MRPDLYAFLACAALVAESAEYFTLRRQNASNTTGNPARKNRSDDKGPAPERRTWSRWTGKRQVVITGRNKILRSAQDDEQCDED